MAFSVILHELIHMISNFQTDTMCTYDIDVHIFFLDFVLF